MLGRVPSTTPRRAAGTLTPEECGLLYDAVRARMDARGWGPTHWPDANRYYRLQDRAAIRRSGLTVIDDIMEWVRNSAATVAGGGQPTPLETAGIRPEDAGRRLIVDLAEVIVIPRAGSMPTGVEQVTGRLVAALREVPVVTGARRAQLLELLDWWLSEPDADEG